MRYSMRIIATAVVMLLGFEAASAYTAYLLGRKTLPGCDFGQGNTCVVKIDLPGPPEIPESWTGEADIDYNTATEVGTNHYVAASSNPTEFLNQYDFTILAIWYKTDGTSCPIPE